MFSSFIRDVAGLVMVAVMMPWSARAAMDDYAFVKLQALDKSTARTETFVAEVGSTIQYGSLFIKIQSCRKAQPIDKPESVSFLQIWEVPHGAEKSTWIFSGWMFASSPALSAMDHPVYDVWVLDCQSDKNKKDEKAVSTPSAAEPKAQDDLTAVPQETPKAEDDSVPVTQTPEPSVPQKQVQEEQAIPEEDTSPVDLPPANTPQTLIPSAPVNDAPAPPEANVRPSREPVFKQEAHTASTDYALGTWSPPE